MISAGTNIGQDAGDTARKAEYIRLANLARRKADEAIGPDIKTDFLEMAAGWDKLAEEIALIGVRTPVPDIPREELED